MSSATTSKNLDKAIDVLNTCRTEWLTVAQIAELSGITRWGVSKTLAVFEARGVVLVDERESRRGKPARIYTVSPAWGGSAPVQESRTVAAVVTGCGEGCGDAIA